MKKILAIMMIIMALFLVACGKKDAEGTNTPDSSDKPKTSGSSNKSETSDPSNEDSRVEMGELAIFLAGDAITLPISVEEYMALGWEPSGKASAEKIEGTLNPKEFTYVTLVKGDYVEQPYIANLTDDVITASQGTIVGFDSIRSDEMLELPNGIVHGVSTMEDVKAAYGEPYEVDPWGKYTRYNMEGFFVTVWEYEESGLLGSVKIQFQDWENFERV